MNLNKIYNKCGEHSSASSFLENLTSSIHYMQFLCCQITENVWKNSGFWKVTKDSYALIQIYRLITDLQLVVSFKFFRVTFSKGEVANIFNKQELVDSVSPYKRLISHYLVLITHHAVSLHVCFFHYCSDLYRSIIGSDPLLFPKARLFCQLKETSSCPSIIISVKVMFLK